MNTKHKITVILAIAMILVLGVGMLYAQGNGNGNGAGGNAPAQNCSGDCIAEPQLHAYNHGGIGFANAQNGARWDDTTRGNMRSNRQNNAQSGPNGTGYYAMLPPAVEGTLSDEVVAAMVAGWMDEQNAYAVYQSVIEQFGEVNPFVNIQRAEAQHIAAWELLFDRYGIAVPAVPVVDAMPALDSVSAACQAAADAEIANFGLYDEMLETLGAYPDMVQVVTALRNASEFNHLPAFQNCAG